MKVFHFDMYDDEGSIHSGLMSAVDPLDVAIRLRDEHLVDLGDADIAYSVRLLEYYEPVNGGFWQRVAHYELVLDLDPDSVDAVVGDITPVADAWSDIIPVPTDDPEGV